MFDRRSALRIAAGKLSDRREHPRVAGKFKSAEDAVYQVIRKQDTTPNTTSSAGASVVAEVLQGSDAPDSNLGAMPMVWESQNGR